MTPAGVPAVLRTMIGARQHPRADRRTLEAFQDALLRRIVRPTYANVPYYRALFDVRHGE
jgi:phenylacetate-coenzyme A ligase PaaK-like adenylate-forming protein